MEDAILFDRISKQVFLFGVFDGHGGMEVAQFVSKCFSSILQQNFQFQSGNYEQALKQTFYKIDKLLELEQTQKQLRQITKQNGLQPFEDGKVADSVGCTAIVILLVKNTLYVANAGDSRAGLSRNGQMVQLSKDHKPDNQQQKQRIIEAGGIIDKGRINNHLNLSRSLGDLHYKKNQQLEYHKQIVTGHPQVKTIELTKQDQFLIIGCDGIWQRYQTNGQGLIQLIRNERMKGIEPQKVIQNMLDSFVAKDPSQQIGCDNMSLILIQFNKLKL